MGEGSIGGVFNENARYRFIDKFTSIKKSLLIIKVILITVLLSHIYLAQVILL